VISIRAVGLLSQKYPCSDRLLGIGRLLRVPPPLICADAIVVLDALLFTKAPSAGANNRSSEHTTRNTLRCVRPLLELAFSSVPGPLYEYACHEGNYAIVSILGAK